MLPYRVPSRLVAFLVHLAISAVIVGGVAALMFAVWYPGSFRYLAGGITLFLIIAAVDIVLGPLLTFVVFNPSKSRRELGVDLGVIALVQISALAYGVWTMAAARPVFLAFEIDLFRVVTAAEVDEAHLSDAPPELRELPWRGPALIGTSKPQGAAQQYEATLLGLSGVHLAMQPQYWRPYDAQRAQIWERGQPVSSLPADLQRRLPTELQYWPGGSAARLDALRWLPVMASRTNATVFVDRSGTPVAFAPFEAP